MKSPYNKISAVLAVKMFLVKIDLIGNNIM